MLSQRRKWSTTMLTTLMLENPSRPSTSTIVPSVSLNISCIASPHSQLSDVTAALKDLHIVERTPNPLDLLDSDDTPVGQMNREQLEAIVRRFRVSQSPPALTACTDTIAGA
jgi:hypothetical protein